MCSRKNENSGASLDFGNDLGVCAQASRILQAEAEAILAVSRILDGYFDMAVREILSCSGTIIVTGIGKAGLVGKKIAATLASTGTPSQFLHPSEAIHGDLGSVASRDILLVLSYSGETAEVVRFLPTVGGFCQSVIAITKSSESWLGRTSDIVISLGEIEEAGHLGLAPSCTTAAMMAVGDALALITSQQRGFKAEDFARNHPGGSLGLQLATVDSIMRPLADCRLAGEQLSVREVVVCVSKPGRRSGAIMLVDSSGELRGIFTDSDLARLLERRGEAMLDCPVSKFMTTSFVTISSGAKLPEAVNLMAEKKISELPVLDAKLRPIGMIDITDVMGLYTSSQTLPERHISGPNRNRPDAGTAWTGRPESEVISFPMYRKSA